MDPQIFAVVPLEVSMLTLNLDLAGVFVFALSGALVRVLKQLNIVGVLVLAGVGVGMLRVLAGRTRSCCAPPVRDPLPLAGTAAVGRWLRDPVG